MTAKSDTQKKSKVDRRQFLGFAWLTSILVFTGETLTALFQFVQPVTAGGFGGIVKAGKLDKFAQGSVTYFQQGRFYLHRLDEIGRAHV